VSGNARLDDLTEHLGFQIDAEGIDTIGGFIFTRLGYMPSSGTKLEIPGLMITVRRAGRKRIEEVLLEKTTNAFEEAALRLQSSSLFVAGSFRFSSTESKAVCYRSIQCDCGKM